eukprot:3492939-Heterocapsa_arctica.AAC.1
MGSLCPSCAALDSPTSIVMPPGASTSSSRSASYACVPSRFLPRGGATLALAAGVPGASSEACLLSRWTRARP